MRMAAARFPTDPLSFVRTVAYQRELVAELVAAYEADPSRLDPDLRRDWESAAGDASALRVVVDQVASLTDVRAIDLHRRWCRATTT
jgi:dGTPase